MKFTGKAQSIDSGAITVDRCWSAGQLQSNECGENNAPLGRYWAVYHTDSGRSIGYPKRTRREALRFANLLADDGDAWNRIGTSNPPNMVRLRGWAEAVEKFVSWEEDQRSGRPKVYAYPPVNPGSFDRWLS